MLSVLFFFSGMPALIYQLVWQRALFRIFGVNIESVTIVVTAFMLGLGLGSLAGGWLSKRQDIKLLPLLAAIEFSIGLFGLVSLPMFDAVGDLVLGLPLPVTSGVTLALVIVPTLLMGATLPVLVGHLVRRTRNVGDSVGQLYYVNTLGAGAVCLLASVTLFPFVGMTGSIYFAAAMNAAVGIAALIAHRRYPESSMAAAMPAARKLSSDAPSDLSAGPAVPPVAWPSVLMLALFSGYVSLSFEIFFFRVVSFMSGSNAIAFTATLGAFLIGLAGGSREAGALCRSGAAPAQIQGKIIRNLALAALVALLFLPILAHGGFLGRALTGVALFLVYLVTRLWGGFLPYLAHRGFGADKSAGQRLSYLYLANILGSAAGGILTGFVLMDLAGMRELGAILGGLGLGFTWFAAIALRTERPIAWRRGFALTAAPLLLLAFQLPLTGRLIEVLQLHENAAASLDFVHIVENRSGVITVDDTGAVFGHGMYDGRFNIGFTNNANNIERAYAIQLYHPAARRVLVVGLSSGSWAQVIANAPDVESVTIVEINPGYIDLVAQQPEVASLLRNPKVRIVIDDGRRWLRQHPGERFDVIAANTAIHFRSNATNVLSLEFQQLARSHLSPGGRLFYNTSHSRRAMRTGCEAFPYGVRIENFMAVGDTPIRLDGDAWRADLLAWRIDGKAMLDPEREGDAVLLKALQSMPTDRDNPALAGTAKRIEDCTGILSETAGLSPITDDNMGTEWRYPLGLE